MKCFCIERKLYRHVDKDVAKRGEINKSGCPREEKKLKKGVENIFFNILAGCDWISIDQA